MSVTNQVRDYFTGRIYKVIDEKTKELREQIDQKKVNQLAIELVLKQLGIPEAMKEHEHIKKLEKQVKDKETALKNKIGKAMNEDTGNEYMCWRDDKWQEVVNVSGKHSKALTAELYPEQQKSLAHLQKIRDSVTESVMLATTEQKLVAALNKLVEQYSNEVDGLSNLVINK
jgi:hypothetical protein